MTEDQMAAVHARLAELRACMLDDDEEPMSEESVAALLRFCERINATDRPLISVDPMGNLHANWLGDSARLILAFHPDGAVDMVLNSGDVKVYGPLPTLRIVKGEPKPFVFEDPDQSPQPRQARDAGGNS